MERALESKHWIEVVSEKLLSEKKPPFLLTAGVTTSGPLHLGTLCEFLFPSAIKNYLERQGHKTEFIFFADILDALDSVPAIFEKYTNAIAPYLGVPLCNVPDPLGCHPSFGEHFFSEVEWAMREFEVKAKILRINELYKNGSFDKFAKLFLKNFEKTKEVIARSSVRELPSDWNAIMPICKKCGKIATTIVKDFDESSYSYSCARDVKYAKGCGFEGEDALSSHNYKLTWRLHWPCWMNIFEKQTSLEFGGVDHFTRGGSWDSAVAIHKEILRKEAPIGYKFGFVLFGGKKYSKSKGIGLGISELLELEPPELIKYQLLKPDLHENKDIAPNAAGMLRLFEDYNAAARLDAELSRADRKRKTAYSYSSEKRKWEADFSDILLYYQVYRDWKKVAELLGDRKGVAYLKKYAENWLSKNYLPEEYDFRIKPKKPAKNSKAVLDFANSLQEGMDALAIHNLVFELARKNNIQPAEFFSSIYTSLLSKERGPRMGKLIEAIGIKKTKEIIKSAIE